MKITNKDQPKYEAIFVDADNLAYRNYFANSTLSFNGQLTGAIFGFVNSLLHLKNKFKCSNFFICWSHDNSLRRKIYREYKATRSSEGKEDYFRQRKILEELLNAMGLLQIVAKGFEADDVIATLCEDVEHFEKALIVSDDKDLLQLTTGNIHVFRKNEPWDWIRTIDEYNLSSPSEIPFYLSIIGDKSDNISGVPQIGPKKLGKLIEMLPDGVWINAILDSEPGTNDKTLLRLREYRETIKRNVQLIKLPYILVEPEDNIIPPPEIDKEKVMEFMATLGFASLISPVMEWINGN